MIFSVGLSGVKMPLPNATPPEESRIYNQLHTLTGLPATGAVTPDLIDSLRNGQFIEAEYEDELRRIILVGLATNTLGIASGFMGGTQTVNEATNTSGSIYETFAPGVGETWELVALSGTMATGITRIEFKLYDSTTSKYVEFAQLDADGAAEMDGYPVTIGYPCTFVSHPRGSYSSGTNYTYYSVIRRN